MSGRPDRRTRLLLGSYTGSLPHVTGTAEGIHAVELSAASGRFGSVTTAAVTPSPSYLAHSADGRFVFAVNESACFADGVGGVSSFARIGGRLEPLGMRPSSGRSPCHLAVSPDGGRLLVANYLDGIVSALPISDDGRLGEPLVIHRPDSTAARAHMCAFDPITGGLLVIDLGLDAILCFDRTDPEFRESPTRIALETGAGPRHLVFAPGGVGAFVVNERAGSVTVLHRGSSGLAVGPTISMSPAGHDRTSPAERRLSQAASAIRMSPTGRHLLAANRRRGTIAVFRVESDPLRIELRHELPAGGGVPRDFAFVGTDLLVVGHQDDHSLTSFRWDDATGRARPLDTVHAPTPVALLEA